MAPLARLTKQQLNHLLHAPANTLSMEELRHRRFYDGMHIRYERGCTIVRFEQLGPRTFYVYEGEWDKDELFQKRTSIKPLGYVRAYPQMDHCYWRCDADFVDPGKHWSKEDAVDILLTAAGY